MNPPVPESDEIQQQKVQLRSSMRKRRRLLEPELREQWNTSLKQRVMERLVLMQPCPVAAYLAFDGEPDLSGIFPALVKAGFSMALPFIENHGDASRMVFRHWHPGDELSNNPMGFAEPHLGENIAVAKLGVILMPLVAWNKTGARLGMGAGYYDRALAASRAASSPLRIGIAYEIQRCDELPTNPHDVPMHELISDSQRFTFSG